MLLDRTRDYSTLKVSFVKVGVYVRRSQTRSKCFCLPSIAKILYRPIRVEMHFSATR